MIKKIEKFEIEIRNESGRKLPLPKIKKITAGILRLLGWKNAGLSLLFVRDPEIRKINRRYLNHDRPTDVIAFASDPPFLGDIVISTDTAERQAGLYGNLFFYELIFYICHGILHIMGYDDHRVKDAKKMEDKQKKILKQIGL